MTLGYYPFGLKQKGYNDVVSANGNSLAQNWKFGGKELNQELGLEWYDFGARNYDCSLGRWMVTDPLAEIYLSYSPYCYVANNPILFVDPDGMKIDLGDLFKDGFQGGGVQLLFDLSEQTGLNLSVSFDSDGSAMLDYLKNEDGSASVVTSEDGQQLGSTEARSSITDAIDDPDTVKVGVSNTGEGSKALRDENGRKTNNIQLDIDQIDSHINSTPDGVNKKTLGYGMTFLHELPHTLVGGSFNDPDNPYATGDVVDIVNIIRKQLDANPLNTILGNGTQYGERVQYGGFLISRISENETYDRLTLSIPLSIKSKDGTYRETALQTSYLIKKD